MLLLPSDDQIEEMERRIVALGEEIAEVEKEATAAMSPGRKRSRDVEKAKVAEERLGRLRWEQAQVEEALSSARRIRERTKEHTKVHEFVMRRYSFNDKKAAEDDATDLRDMMPVVRRGDLMVNLLFACMESWTLDDEITKEGIGELDPRLVEVLYNKLVWKSEPSPERLNFLALSSTTS